LKLKSRDRTVGSLAISRLPIRVPRIRMTKEFKDNWSHLNDYVVAEKSSMDELIGIFVIRSLSYSFIGAIISVRL
jgi:hypothetical protein